MTEAYKKYDLGSIVCLDEMDDKRNDFTIGDVLDRLFMCQKICNFPASEFISIVSSETNELIFAGSWVKLRMLPSKLYSAKIEAIDGIDGKIYYISTKKWREK